MKRGEEEREKKNKIRINITLAFGWLAWLAGGPPSFSAPTPNAKPHPSIAAVSELRKFKILYSFLPNQYYRYVCCCCCWSLLEAFTRKIYIRLYHRGEVADVTASPSFLN
jgi:hypothetical protein